MSSRYHLLLFSFSSSASSPFPLTCYTEYERALRSWIAHAAVLPRYQLWVALGDKVGSLTDICHADEKRLRSIFGVGSYFRKKITDKIGVWRVRLCLRSLIIFKPLQRSAAPERPVP